MSSGDFGYFVGSVQVEWINHDGADRDMILLSEFKYVDGQGKEWVAPEGKKINGASIPSVFWQMVGPPFVGDYRRASVVHDVYCDTKTETWRATHRMFRDACRAGGVSASKARLMYAAVYARGPRWGMAETPFTTYEGRTVAKGYALEIYNHINDDDLLGIFNRIEREDLSTEEIEELIDQSSSLNAFPVS